MSAQRLRLAEALRTLEPADVKRLRPLEQENGRLKKMIVDRELELDVIKKIAR